VDLNDRLGTLPSGNVARLSDDHLTSFLRDKYLASSAEKARRANATMRRDFYRGHTHAYFEDDLRTLFKNPRVFEWRKALIPFARFQNITARIVNEISTVYDEPATRTIKGANEKYKRFLRRIRMDKRMQKINQRLNLLDDLLIYPSIDPLGRDRLYIVTPDHFYAISHPNDPTCFIGAIIDQVPKGIEVREASPHYMVCDEDTWFWLDKDFRMVRDTGSQRRPHGLGRLPVILAQRDPPEDALLTGDGRSDLVSAHRAIALLNVLMLKAQKSGTRLPIATGDTSGMAREQPMDEEGLIEAPEGVALTALDLRADPDNYITAARAVIKQIAANYGIPESVFDLSYQATSGFEIELKRVGLKEVRHRQMLDFRPLEEDIADLQSRAMKGREFAFSPDGWRISFGEVETPIEPMAKLLYWEKLQQMSLANIVEMYMWQNPEVKADEATRVVEANMNMYLERIRLFQQESAGVADADGNDADTAQAGGDGEMTLEDRVNAVGMLIRAGFDPAGALAVVGLPPIPHIGLLPVTLKSESEAEGDRFDDTEEADEEEVPE
jgi:hypothetical protein